MDQRAAFRRTDNGAASLAARQTETRVTSAYAGSPQSATLIYDLPGRFRHMKAFASAVLAMLTLAGSTLAVAGGKPTDAGSKPSSYVSRPHTNRHIYGSPIGPPIVGRAAAPHHTHAHMKQPTSATTRNAHKAPVGISH